MTANEMRQEIQKTIARFPEPQLKAILGFIRFLDGNDFDENFQLQMRSTAYREWLSEENDVYEEVFKDELQTR